MIRVHDDCALSGHDGVPRRRPGCRAAPLALPMARLPSCPLQIVPVSMRQPRRAQHRRHAAHQPAVLTPLGWLPVTRHPSCPSGHAAAASTGLPLARTTRPCHTGFPWLITEYNVQRHGLDAARRYFFHAHANSPVGCYHAARVQATPSWTRPSHSCTWSPHVRRTGPRLCRRCSGFVIVCASLCGCLASDKRHYGAHGLALRTAIRPWCGVEKRAVTKNDRFPQRLYV